MRLLAERFSCGHTGGQEWIDKVPTAKMCAEQCEKKVGFINLIDYGRRDSGYSTCNEIGCDCRCVTGSCSKTAGFGYDLYEVAESKWKSVLPTSFAE